MTADARTKWCPTCQTYKAPDDFPRDRSRADGRRGQCRLCSRKTTKRAEDRNADRPHVEVPKQKRCPRCATTKPAAAFTPTLRKLDGLDGWCRDCRAAERRKG